MVIDNLEKIICILLFNFTKQLPTQVTLSSFFKITLFFFFSSFSRTYHYRNATCFPVLFTLSRVITLRRTLITSYFPFLYQQQHTSLRFLIQFKAAPCFFHPSANIYQAKMSVAFRYIHWTQSDITFSLSITL